MTGSHSILWQAIALFVFLMVLFHWLVFSTRPNARTLKKIDYAWLSFAALSLVSAAANYRHLYAHNLLSQATNIVTSDLSMIANDLEFSRRYACDIIWGAPAIKEPDNAFNSHAKACGIIKKIQIDLNNDHRPENVIALVSQPLPKGIGREWDWSSARDIAKNLSKDVRYLNFLKDEAGDTNTEQLFIAFSPFLLAVALALRFVKVTGELLL